MAHMTVQELHQQQLEAIARMVNQELQRRKSQASSPSTQHVSKSHQTLLLGFAADNSATEAEQQRAPLLKGLSRSDIETGLYAGQ